MMMSGRNVTDSEELGLTQAWLPGIENINSKRVYRDIFRALVSYPGSGNTYLRRLITLTTGRETQEERDGVPGGIIPGKIIQSEICFHLFS